MPVMFDRTPPVSVYVEDQPIEEPGIHLYLAYSEAMAEQSRADGTHTCLVVLPCPCFCCLLWQVAWVSEIAQLLGHLALTGAQMPWSPCPGPAECHPSWLLLSALGPWLCVVLLCWRGVIISAAAWSLALQPTRSMCVGLCTSPAPRPRCHCVGYPWLKVLRL